MIDARRLAHDLARLLLAVALLVAPVAGARHAAGMAGVGLLAGGAFTLCDPSGDPRPADDAGQGHAAQLAHCAACLLPVPAAAAALATPAQGDVWQPARYAAHASGGIETLMPVAQARGPPRIG
jgi:hypothetical protein